MKLITFKVILIIVQVSSPAGLCDERASECCMQALLRIQIQAQAREIRAQGESHQVGIRFCSPNER